MNTETDFLLIESIYDPLSHRADGVITPYAPIMVMVSDTLPGEGERVEFYLRPDGKEELIRVNTVYFHNEHKVVATLPYLPPGKYRPLMMLYKEDTLVQTFYSRQEVVWTVKENVR